MHWIDKIKMPNITDDKQLAKELCSPQFIITNPNITIETQSEIKKKIAVSHDMPDSIPKIR